METILRTRSDIREKSLNGIRQILDAAPEFKGLLWLFTGTPDFFDSAKGVAGLAPLHDRIHFRVTGRFVNVKQPQLELKPFDRDRLIEAAMRLRELYPSDHKHRVHRHVTDDFIQRLVDRVAGGFGGDVGVAPRRFLRELTDIFDLIDQNETYNPAAEYSFTLEDPTPEEMEAIRKSKKDDGGQSDDIEDIEF